MIVRELVYTVQTCHSSYSTTDGLPRSRQVASCGPQGQGGGTSASFVKEILQFSRACCTTDHHLHMNRMEFRELCSVVDEMNSSMTMLRVVSKLPSANKWTKRRCERALAKALPTSLKDLTHEPELGTRSESASSHHAHVALISVSIISRRIASTSIPSSRP